MEKPLEDNLAPVIPIERGQKKSWEKMAEELSDRLEQLHAMQDRLNRQKEDNSVELLREQSRATKDEGLISFLEEEASGLESLGKELSDALEKAAEYLSKTVDGINSVEAVLARREKELSLAAKPE